MEQSIVSTIFTRDASGFSQVSLKKDYFKQIVGFDKKDNPLLLPYETKAGKNEAGEKIGIRVFTINGFKVYTHYNKETKALDPIYMSTADAETNYTDDSLPFVFGARQ